MGEFESLEIPNLSGQVSLGSVRPVFNGAYSSVFHGKLGDHLVAVKVLKEIYGADVRTMQRKLKRERTTWSRLRHPNVLPLLGFADDHELFQPYGALISPWRAEGNACEFLKSRGSEMSIFKRVDMWKGVVAGVAYLHNHTPVLVHGDLKSANVLIDNSHEPQICDFGLVSIFLEEGSSGMTTTSEHTGTDRYLAYELVLGGETAAPTTASDMFALGCIGLEFCFLQQPYAHRKNNRQGQIFIDIRAGVPPATRPAPSGPWNEALWAALDRCWEGHPSDRIGARDLQTLVDEALRFVDSASQYVIQPRGSPDEPMDENSVTDTKPAQLSGLRHTPIGSEHVANISHGINRPHPNESISHYLSMEKMASVPPTGGPSPSPQGRHELILHENLPNEIFPTERSHMDLILNPPRTTRDDSMPRKDDIMPQPDMTYHASALGGQFPTHLNAENSTASYAASTVHPAGTSNGSQYRAQDTMSIDDHTITPMLDAPGFWGSGMLPGVGDTMSSQHSATETGLARPFTAGSTEEYFAVPDSGMTSGETQPARLFQPLRNDQLPDRPLTLGGNFGGKFRSLPVQSEDTAKPPHWTSKLWKFTLPFLPAGRSRESSHFRPVDPVASMECACGFCSDPQDCPFKNWSSDYERKANGG